MSSIVDLVNGPQWGALFLHPKMREKRSDLKKMLISNKPLPGQSGIQLAHLQGMYQGQLEMLDWLEEKLPWAIKAHTTNQEEQAA